MSLYPDPSTVNMTNPTNLFSYIGQVTTFYFFNVYDIMLFGLWFIILAGSYKSTDDFSWALGISGFAIFVLGLLAWLGGLVSGYMMAVYIGIAIIGAVAFLSS